MSHSVTLVTGAPGWLATRLIEVLVRGYEGEGPTASGRKTRCLILKGVDAAPLRSLSPDLEFVAGDLRAPDSLDSAVEGVDVVFHAAGVIHTTRIRDLYAINAQGTRNLLAAAAKRGVRRLVYISSNSVGGFTGDGRLMHESDPPRPYMAYGHSKLLAEQAVKRFAAEGKLEAIILRPCWFYGPGQPERQTRFFRMIRQGRPIIFGDGTNLRSMSYLDNTVQGILLAETAPAATGQVYWIADEKPYQTIEIYRTVAELLDVKEFRPRHVPGLASELCRVADWFTQTLGLYRMTVHVGGEMNKHIACAIDKARTELGYRPTIALREGMRRSIEWCRRTGLEL